MIDVERLLKGLEYCQGVMWCCDHDADENCPYRVDCMSQMQRDAVSVIKSQQAEIAFLKGMQLQTVKDMDDVELGRSVGKMLGMW